MANILKPDEIIDLEVFIADDEKESAEYKKSRDFSFYSKAPDSAKANQTSLRLCLCLKYRKKARFTRPFAKTENGFF